MKPSRSLVNLVPDLLAKVKAAFFDQSADLLDIRYNDYLHSPADPQPRKAKPRKAKPGNVRRYYPDANSTDKLRTLYGNLSRALSRKGHGNIFNVEATPTGLKITSGIDISVMVNAGGKSIPLIYAFYNEATRPFQGPGFADYVTIDYPEQIEGILNELEKHYGE